MIRCSICALSAEQHEALAEALRAGVSLQAISDKTNLTKSSSWRHSRRLDRADGQAKQNAMAPNPSTVPAAAPATMPAPKEQPTAVVPTTTKELDQPVSNIVPAKPRSREDTLAKLDYLWGDALDGLEASKKPLIVTKADGTEIEVPGDLRCRAAFLNVATKIVQTGGRIHGGCPETSTSRRSREFLIHRFDSDEVHGCVLADRRVRAAASLDAHDALGGQSLPSGSTPAVSRMGHAGVANRGRFPP